MNHPHLYIKSLLEEIKELNKKMITTHEEAQRQRFLGRSSFSDYVDQFRSEIESMSLEIEQLNQEIVNTIKSMENK